MFRAALMASLDSDGPWRNRRCGGRPTRWQFGFAFALCWRSDTTRQGFDPREGKDDETR